jgi:uncharacterized protein YqjF (DUF2071 family)
VPYESLRRIVPDLLHLDSFEGSYYISIVAFTMQKIRPRNLPSVKIFSDFHELNVRTYIENDGKKGVYFINIEAQKTLSALMARSLSGLPYEKSNMTRQHNYYSSKNEAKNFHLEVKFTVQDTNQVKTESDKWLTERYCLYLAQNNTLYRYEVHHKEWEIEPVKIEALKVNYKVGEIMLTENQPYIAHYSKGVQVLAWGKEKIAV